MLFALLWIFVALCLDRGNAMMNSRNPVALLADALGFPAVEAGAYGFVPVALVAVYAAVFTVAFLYERRLAVLNGKRARSGKMIGIYALTFAVCLLLSLGLGIVVQPTLSSVRSALTFFGESLAVTLLLSLVLTALCGSVAMLVVNLCKRNRSSDLTEGNGASIPSGAEKSPEETAKAPQAPGLCEEREVVFPALSAIDATYSGRRIKPTKSGEVTLKSLCEGFRSYLAQTEKLYFDADTIRLFVSGLYAGEMVLLEGLSGTGKSSLPRYFAEYVNGKSVFLAVQSTWRDRTDLLGYFNDFSKRYNETEFLSALYEANWDREKIYVFVLDELNISRVEYYFADFLSVLEYPEKERKLKILQLPYGFRPPEMLAGGYIAVPQNVFFVGTANKDESTFSISDKVYDRAVTVSFEKRNEPFAAERGSRPIFLSASAFRAMFTQAETDYAMTESDYEKFTEVTEFVRRELDLPFGNRVLNQIGKLVPAFVACGGEKETALDYLFAGKLLAKSEGRYGETVKESLQTLLSLLAKTYGENGFGKSRQAVARLLRNL